VKRLPLLAGALLGAAGVAQLGLLLYIFAHRIAYPLDLEWMEGGMLGHALRVLEGKPIYAPPSVDFISYLYTPFYPFVVAMLGKVFGLSYLLGRVVSVLSFLVVLALGFRLVQRRTGGGLAGALFGLGAAGLICSTFPATGAWYDLVRNDSLYLALTTGFLYLIAEHSRSWRALCLAGVLAGLAFLTKQTASLFIVYSGLALLLLRWRRLPVYVALVGAVAGGAALLLNHLTHGWFWRYTYGMHQGHDLYKDRLWPVTELTLLRTFPVVGAVLGVWLLAAALSWIRARRVAPEDRRELYWFVVALTGVAVSAVGFATQWASSNAYIPGLVFPGLFAVLAVAALQRLVGGARRPLLAGVVGAVVGGAIAVQMLVGLYSPRRHLPTARDRQTGAELIALLRAQPGPVLLPYHPFYAHLAGKPAHYHQMGINDVTRAGYPWPPSVIETIQQKRYSTVILDNPPQGRYDFLLAPYKLQRYFRADEVPHVPEGYQVHPTYLFVPKRPDPEPAGGRRVFGFEGGSFAGWRVLGDAFGQVPAGGPVGDQGPVGPFEGSYLANSYHGGDRSVGVLLSPELEVDRPVLAFRVGGGNDRELLQVRLLVEEREVHRETGPGTDVTEDRRVDVRAYRGKKMRVEVVDRATGPWGHLVFDDVRLLEGTP
jgi:4-amino-4-deoxy-L-arabinose transferase-like glycosyltransferase